MAVVSGLNGHVSKENVGGGSQAPISCVQAWTVSDSAETKEATCSGSNGAKFRIQGNTDWSGNYSAYGDIPAVLPGDTFGFIGVISGGAAADGVGVSGDAICDSVTISLDITSGAIISHTVNFSATGALTYSNTLTSPLSVVAGVALPRTARAMTVQIATSDPYTSFSEISEVETVELTITRDNPSYVSSTTAGATSRVIGNLDLTVSVGVKASSTAGWNSLPKPNDIAAIKIFTTASLFWLVEFIRWGELSDIGVAIESNEIVSGTMNGALHAYAEKSGLAAEGKIVTPASVTYWP